MVVRKISESIRTESAIESLKDSPVTISDYFDVSINPNVRVTRKFVFRVPHLHQ